MIAENPVPCEDAFFVVERTYVEIVEPKNGRLGLFEQYSEFWCKAVFEHPATGLLSAIGLARVYRSGPWEGWPVIYDISEWEGSTWFRSFNGGEEDKPDAG